MRWRLVLACAATLAGCAGADAAPPDERPYLEAGGAGVTLALPDGWQALPPRDGNIVDPLTRVAIASGPLREPVPACETQVTRYAPEADGVSVVILEWKAPYDGTLPRRPPSFDQAALPLRPGDIECFAGDGGIVQFIERGRVFGVYVLVGERAEPDLVGDARGALETLRVETLRGY
jgi:hypothetical protein